jgi:hypothetical protein
MFPEGDRRDHTAFNCGGRTDGGVLSNYLYVAESGLGQASGKPCSLSRPRVFWKAVRPVWCWRRDCVLRFRCCAPWFRVFLAAARRRQAGARKGLLPCPARDIVRALRLPA